MFEENVNLPTFNVLSESREVRLSYSEKGTKSQKFVPVMKTEFFFPNSMGLEHIINAFHNPKQRAQWDNNLECYSTIKKIGKIALIHE